jgi:hypothetical protein
VVGGLGLRAAMGSEALRPFATRAVADVRWAGGAGRRDYFPALAHGRSRRPQGNLRQVEFNRVRNYKLLVRLTVVKFRV